MNSFRLEEHAEFKFRFKGVELKEKLIQTVVPHIKIQQHMLRSVLELYLFRSVFDLCIFSSD